MKVENEPIVSIITVVYNAAATIAATILSVINIKNSQIEYIVIDGGSTDGTIEIIKKYDDNISFWISEPDNGIYDAMNKGVSYANGKWLYFIGADDLLLYNISELIPFLQNNLIVYGNVRYLTSNRVYNGRFNSLKLLNNNIPHQAILYPISVFQKYRYETYYTIYADYYLNILCWNDINFKFKYIPFTIALYNDTGISSVNVDYRFQKSQFSIFMKNMPWYLLPYVFIRKLPSLIFRHIIFKHE